MNTSASLTSRVNSIDILRGLVMVIMALDHVRDMWGPTNYLPEDLTRSSAAFFFTRWITHFCAPTFIFISGISAWLYGQRKTKPELSRFLFTRGLWLIFAEVMLVNPAWNFAWFWQSGTIILQVIWVIGLSMVLLSALIYLPYRTLLLFSLLVIFGHNLLDKINTDDLGAFASLWKVLHVGFGWIPLNDAQSMGIVIVYPLIPWLAVMSLGYTAGKLFVLPKEQRTKTFLLAGLGAIALFLLLRLSNLYGDPYPWHPQERGKLFTMLDILNVTKYPPSLQFLCLTVGLGSLFLAVAESWKGRLVEILTVYGKVPFFFYLIHMPIIHTSSYIYQVIRYGRPVVFKLGEPDGWPADYKMELWLIYLAWALTIIVLYFLCKWYNRYRETHRYWWLKYI